GEALRAACEGGGDLLYPWRAEGDDWRNLPNRFIVLYPTAQEAAEGARRARAALRNAWGDMAKGVKKLLDAKWQTQWDHGWNVQVESFWDVRTLVVDLEAWKDEEYRALFGLGPDEPCPDPLTRGWRVTSAALAAAKSVRWVPPDQGMGRPKCTMMGDLEQMGPGGGVGAQREWWRRVAGTSFHGVPIAEGERLCAVALVKRFAPVYPNSPLSSLCHPVPDTAGIATAHWRCDVRDKGLAELLETFEARCKDLTDYLEGAGETLGHYLVDDNIRYDKRTWIKLNERLPHDRRERVEAWEESKLANALKAMVDARGALAKARRKAQLPPPPRYLALVELDGDHMGRHLGGNGRALTREHFQQLSGKLLEYGAQVPGMVSQHHGECIYAGGDEVLALCPRSDALSLVMQLRRSFPKELAAGEGATASAGITLFHYHHDLREALRQAHHAIERAKNAGRDRCGISVLKRSGGDVQMVASWDLLEAVNVLAQDFDRGASDRWASHLRQMLPSLSDAVPPEALRALIRRAAEHAEKAPCLCHVLDLWDKAWAFHNGDEARAHTEGIPPSVCIFGAFLDLVNLASFLVRGGE
ncbi:MAG: type III-B CRISPR-associated protein Cas10/Cmr2, partial [Armatimonadota bacterium]|nr:type III-B CRISPR-associated protein Cas10/Cmr2 [Armatimonadota bacterium]